MIVTFLVLDDTKQAELQTLNNASMNQVVLSNIGNGQKGIDKFFVGQDGFESFTTWYNANTFTEVEVNYPDDL